MDPGRRPVVVELPSHQALADPIHQPGTGRAQRPLPLGGPRVRQQPGGRVELAPATELLHCQALSADEAVAVPAGRPRAERRGAGRVGDRQCPAQRLCRACRRTCRLDPVQGDVPLADLAHADDGCSPGFGGLAQPRQAGRFPGEEIPWRVGPAFDEHIAVGSVGSPGHELGDRILMVSAALRMAGTNSVTCSGAAAKCRCGNGYRGAQSSADVQDRHADGSDAGFGFLDGGGLQLASAPHAHPTR